MNSYKVDGNNQKACMQKEFFNQRASKWDNNTTHDADKIEYLLSLLQLNGHERILDVGTGTGILLPFYMRHLKCGRITAIDFSEKMIEIAQSKFPAEKYPQVECIISDVYDLKYSTEFDVVMCYSCFPHFKEKPQAISILKKALKPQGKFVVAHSNSRDKINRVHMDSEKEVARDILPTLSDLKKMIQNAGLEIIFTRDDEDFFITIAKKK